METNISNQIMRSQNGWFAGVCEGLSESSDIPVGWIRLAWIVSVFFLGFGILLYVVASFCLPLRDRDEYRDPRKVLGVCSRLAEHFQIDTGIVRILMVFSAFASFGLTLFGYIILHFIVPQEAALIETHSKEN